MSNLPPPFPPGPSQGPPTGGAVDVGAGHRLGVGIGGILVMLWILTGHLQVTIPHAAPSQGHEPFGDASVSSPVGVRNNFV